MNENEIALEALRIWNENKETLVAKFIIENPDIPLERIRITQGVDVDGNLSIARC